LMRNVSFVFQLLRLCVFSIPFGFHFSCLFIFNELSRNCESIKSSQNTILSDSLLTITAKNFIY
jgi:hypothetical protein